MTSDEIKSTIEALLAESKIDEAIKVLQQARQRGENITFQIGKSVINITEGRDIHIGDRIYQLTDSQSLKDFFLPLLEELQSKKKLPSYEELINTWIARVETRRRLICQRELRGKPNIIDYVQSPLQNHWGDFIKATPWHEEVDTLLSSIRNGIHHAISLIKGSSRYKSVNIKKFNEFLQEANKIKSEKIYIEIFDHLEEVVNKPIFGDIRLQVEKLLNLIGDSLERQGEALEAIQKLKQSLSDLKQIIKYVRFKKCFLILGSLGTGKTHFISYLLKESTKLSKSILSPTDETDLTKQEFLAIHLKPINVNSLEQSILQEIRNYSDTDAWQDVKEFDEFLQKNNSRIRLVIIIDDLQQWIFEWSQRGADFRIELKDYIAEHTQLHSIYWLVTLLDTNYDKVADASILDTNYDKDKDTDSSINVFWRKYSFFDDRIQQIRKSVNDISNLIYETLPFLGGWVYLDYLNYTQKLGINIISAHIKKQFIDGNRNKDEKNEFLEIGSIVEEPYVYYISNPLIAWIAIDSSKGSDIEELASLSFSEFIGLFQKIMFSEIDSLGKSIVYGYKINYNLANVQAIISNIVNLMVESSTFFYCCQELVVNLTSKVFKVVTDTYLQRVEQCINLLQDVSLLERLSPAPECSCNEKVNILFEPFWLWQFARNWIGKYDLECDRIRFIEDLQSWMVSVRQEAFREEALIFILLLIDSQDRERIQTSTDLGNTVQPVNKSFVQSIYLEALQNSQFPASASWFAGHRGAEQIQTALVNWAETHQAIIKEKRVLFSFMYFMSQAQVLTIPDRLKLISFYYLKDITKDLAPYFLFIVKRMLSEVREIKTMISCIDYLEGCEVMDTGMASELAHELAKLSINIIVDIHDQTQKDKQAGNSNRMRPVLRTILSCLRNIDRKLKYYQSSNRGPWRRFHFREWLVFEFCRVLMEIEGLKGFDLLMKESWFYPEYLKIHKTVSVEMEREATIAIGYYYRNFMQNLEELQLQEFLKNLRKLIDKGRAKTACFIIYHTVSTSFADEIGVGTITPKIDPILCPILREISQDPSMRRDDFFGDFFRVNLSNS
jgi:hypothetical protein